MKPLIYDVTLSGANVSAFSPDIDASYMTQASVHAVLTGSVNGIQIVLGGTDQGVELVPLVEQFLGVPYVYSTLGTISVTSAGSYIIPVTDICYSKIQVAVTRPPQTVSIDTVADVAKSLAGKYFLISIAPGGSSFTDLYIYYSVSGTGNDPNIPDRTGIQINLTTGDSANTVASETASQLLAVAPSAFASVAAVGNRVTFVQNQQGASGFSDGTPPLDTGFTFNQASFTGSAQVFLKTNNF